jgi:hypothetical protein
MKSLFLRSSVALACALSLAACGGSSGSLLLGGQVFGLTKSGLELQNKTTGPALPISSGQTVFSFNELLGNDEDFEVLVKTQPAGAVCTVTNGKGRSGAFNITSVVVSCVTNTYDLTGTVSGLDADGLVLVNGPDRVVVPKGAPSVAFAKVADGAPYGITVLTQPTGRTCSVANGVGTMGSGPVSNVQVTCV